MDRIGRYKIVRELGRGAMGVVYHAIDPNIGRPVAIKTIQLGARHPEEQERLRERLFREARSAGILSHPGIVTIYDVEQQGDLAYIAMEYVDGPTLDHRLSGRQPIAPAEMFSILGQTAVALDYAHQKGIVHRDIKPANIMIAGDGTAKITDFGIAKITAPEQLTMTGSIVGTPHYMSPEQVQGQPVDGRSDQFSLAVIAYEMLTGEKPYTGEHLTTVVYKIVAEEPAAPHRLNPSLTGGIESVLRKALAKKPDARYRTCQEFADALEAACSGAKGWKTMPRGASLSEPTLADVSPPVRSMPPPYARHGDTTITAQRDASRKSGFLPFLLAILVAAGLLALIGWQAAPWLTPRPAPATQGKETPKQSEVARQASPPAAQGPVNGQPAQGQAREPGAGQAATAAPPEAKPSPMPPAPAPPLETAPPEDIASSPKPGRSTEGQARNPPREAPARTAPIRTAPAQAATQPVMVVSSPGGATATLDGRADAACTTPCSLDATPGRHTIALTMPGYQVERREVNMGSDPLELPPVVLRAPGGTLMLTSVPSGASVQVNGRPIPQTTPAQIPLTPGAYTITVEKGGKQSTKTVDIRNGSINYLRIVLAQ